MKKLLNYLQLWLIFMKYSFQGALSQRLSFIIFFVGKLIRLVMFALFITFLLSDNRELAGFSQSEVVFVYLTYNLVDIIAQFLFREVYRFRSAVVSGNFDLVLTKPVNALFRVLFSGADVMDFATIPLVVGALVLVGKSFEPTVVEILVYVLLVINGLIIAAAFHIGVVSLGIVTLAVDHTIMIYRNLVSLGRLPVNIYREPVRGILTFIIPIGIMITLPSRVFFDFPLIETVIVAFVVSTLALVSSLKFWSWSLKRYTSASS